MDVDAMTNELCIRLSQQVGKDGLDDLICKTEIETRGREQACGHQAGKEGRMHWEVGIDISMPLTLCVEQVANENLLRSARSPSLPRDDLSGRESMKEGDVCVCTADSPCCTAETDPTLQSSYTPIRIHFEKSKSAS